MVRPYTTVETENRNAFVVQLNALLGSLSGVITSNALNAATRAKLEGVQSALEEWRLAIGPLEVSKPYQLTASATQTPLSSAGASPAAAAGDAESAPPGGDDSPATEVTSPVTAPAVPDEATAIGNKSVVDLVDLISLLYTSGLPESVKLRAMAKGVARLLIVRCTTIVYAALQHVARLTYHTSKSRDDTLSAFVLLSKDIRCSTAAMVRCMELICSFAEFTDVSSVRFAQQVCMDALRNVRRAMLHFQMRIDREEVACLSVELGAGGATPSPSVTSQTGSAGDLADEGNDEGGSTRPAAVAAIPVPDYEQLRAHCERRAAWLRESWGPSLARSVVHVGQVMGPAVRFLVSVAGVKEVSGPPGMASLKQDAQADLFALGSPATAPSPKDTPLAEKQGSTSRVPSKTELGDQTQAREAETETEAEQSSASLASAKNSSAEAATDSQHAAAVVSAIASAAALVLPMVGFNYSAECLAVMSECSGDESDGRLVATRIVTDSLRALGDEQPALLHIIVQGQSWKHRLFTGVLNCVVSLHPAVLEAGLNDLHIIVTCCPAALGAEVGYLYNNCLLKLLESENSPIYTKKEIIIHIVTTLLVGRPTVIVGSGFTPASQTPAANVPLLLHLYRLYDLNEGAHQLNVVQQFVAALSRVVRSASLAEFTPITGHEARAEGSEPQAVRVGKDHDKLSLEIQAARHATLPSLALRGLVLLVEVLSTQTPPEDVACTTDVSEQIPTLTCRERKLEGQRRIDVFVSSPKKGIQKIFNVSDDEFNPAGHEEFSAEWDHTKCPAPANAAVAEKIRVVTDFLMNVTSTCPDEVAEFLTTPAVFPLQVCVEYMARLPLAGCGLVGAIQVLLAHVELPKEGQRIERLLEYFSASYFAANNVPGIDRSVFPFLRDDACFVVIVATVMLNTDLHNPLSGSRMNQKNFRGQLKACDKVITNAYADDIFFSISRRPLNSAKSMSAATAAARSAGAGGASGSSSVPGGTSGSQDSYYSFDALFISAEERRKLAFGMEQQRLVSETVSRWQCAIPSLGEAPADWQWWCGVARDLFTCTWPSVCAVFGPAMYQQNAATDVPRALLLECIRGLKALMCVATAFALPTECEVTLLALLGLCDRASVRATCRVATLQVAATGYAVHLTTRCWMQIFQLAASMKTELQPSAMPPQVEAMLALIERVTNVSCAEVLQAPKKDRTEPPKSDPALSSDGTTPAATVPAAAPESVATAATHRVIDGALDALKGFKKGDARSLAAGLYFLRRILQFSRITHTDHSSDVATFVNTRDLAHTVAPRLVALVTRQSGSEEALQSIFGIIADLLVAVWKSSIPIMVAAHERHSARDEEARAASEQAVFDDAVECANVLRGCYEKHIKSALVRSLVLQAVQEVMARTMRTLPGASADTRSSGTGSGPLHPLTIHFMLEFWRRLLCPVAEAMSVREASRAETASLAVLVLRKSVVLTCGTQRTLQIPAPCQAVALVLLTDAAFIGALCGNTETSQACLAQLTTLSGGCLSRDASSASHHARSTPPFPASQDDMNVSTSVAPTDAVSDITDMLLHASITSDGAGERGTTNANARLASYGMERLCLLARAASEQTRNESITNLRTLCLQLKPAHVKPLAQRICGLVVEGLQGISSTPRSRTVVPVPVSPSLAQSFSVLLTEVPQSLKPSSGDALRTTLPALVQLVTQDLLGMAEAAQLGEICDMVMVMCLQPLCAAPRGTIPASTRSVGIKALGQCASLCVSRYQASTAAVPTAMVSNAPAGAASAAHDVHLYFPVQTYLDTVALTLLPLRVTVEDVVPHDAAVPGAEHWARVADPLMDSLLRFHDATTHAETGVTSGTQSAERESQTSTEAARDATAGLSVFHHSDRHQGDGPVSDDELVECCGLMAQLLNGLPHVLAVLLPALAASGWPIGLDVARHHRSHADAATAKPHASADVLLCLLLDAATSLFAMQWRVCHVMEMNAFYQDFHRKGREVQPATQSTALLPHTAVRGVLNSYLELALYTPSQDASALLDVLLGILEGLGAAQQIAANAGSVATQHRLNAQDQQHTRTCSAGMYQELSIVLASWVKTLTACEGSTGGNAVPLERTQALQAAALDARLFLALTSLLTPTAGPLIVTVRDFFAWFIATKGLRPPASNSTDNSVNLPVVQPANDQNGHRHGSFVLEQEDEL